MCLYICTYLYYPFFDYERIIAITMSDDNI